MFLPSQERTRTALLEVLLQDLTRKTNELFGTSSPNPNSVKDSRNFMDNIKRALSKKEPRSSESSMMSSNRKSNGSASLAPVGEDDKLSSVRRNIHFIQCKNSNSGAKLLIEIIQIRVHLLKFFSVRILRDKYTYFVVEDMILNTKVTYCQDI